MAPTLESSDLIEKIWEAFRRFPDDKRLRNRLVEEYMPIVRYNAEKIRQRLPEGIDLEDLVSAGSFGLISAIEAFDPARGVKFETYCAPRIRGAVLDELRGMDWIPRLLRTRANKLLEMQKRLECELGRSPTDQELADRLEAPLAETAHLRSQVTTVNMLSLHKKRSDADGEKDLQEMDLVPDKKSEDPTRRTQKQDFMRLVTKGLSRNERLIIILYYYEELTMKEIGATLGLSESRVSQMHSALLQRLQSQLGERNSEFSSL